MPRTYSTNGANLLITVAPDSAATTGLTPPKPDSVAGLQYALLRERPYALTSDDLLFEVHARRKGIAQADQMQARQDFFGKPQACLRASPLAKTHGWGLHHDAQGKVGLHAVNSDEYGRLAASPGVTVTPAMRARRG